LADKNFSAIASAVSFKAGKITFANKGTVYEIVPYKDIGERFDSIIVGCPWAGPSLQMHPGPQPVRYLLALCDGVPKQGYGAPNTPTHPAA